MTDVGPLFMKRERERERERERVGIAFTPLSLL